MAFLAPNDTADIDASLADMVPSSPGQTDNDMVPLQAAPLELQHDSEASDTDSSASPSHKPSPRRSRAKKIRKAALKTQESKPLLRPANDILSRIRHDPALEASDFVVGYLDRHCPDVMEMDVSSWKGGGDVTDEEWIPQHRIIYFRKKSDEAGRKVWDRAARLDRLFGSGVVADEHASKGPNDKHGAQGVPVTQEECETMDRKTSNAGRGLVPALNAGNDTDQSRT